MSDWGKHIQGRHPFDTGDRLSGGQVTDPFTYCGFLPESLWASWYEACSQVVLGDRLLYAVFSYHTPIAWHDGSGWVIPSVDYSPETTAHQEQLDLCEPVRSRPVATFNRAKLAR